MDLFTTKVREVYEVHPGAGIHDVIRELIDRANLGKCPVVATYNEVEIVVNPGSDFETVKHSFEQEWHRRIEQGTAARR